MSVSLKNTIRQCAMIFVPTLLLVVTSLSYQTVRNTSAAPMVGSIIINEIMIETSKGNNDQWLELRNTTSNIYDFSVTPWRIEKNGNTMLTLNTGSIGSHGYFLISKIDPNTNPNDTVLNITPDIVSNQLDLDTNNVQYRLYNDSNVLVDTADDGNGMIMAGEFNTANNTFRAMERNNLPFSTPFNSSLDGVNPLYWHTARGDSININTNPNGTTLDVGTPKSENLFAIPHNLQVNTTTGPLNSGQITHGISWGANGNPNTTNYELEIQGGAYTNFTSIYNGTNLSYLNTTLDDNTQYSYRVSSLNSVNLRSDFTQAVTVTTPDRTAPTLSFTDNVETGPVTSDTITGNWGDATIRKWDYNSTTSCSNNANDYNQSDTDSMDQNTPTYNNKYICLYGADNSGNFATLASQNDINISTGTSTNSLSFNQNTYSVIEEGSAITMTLSLTNTVSQNTVVSFTSTNSSLIITPNPVTINAGLSSVTVSAVALSDSNTSNETVTVTATANGFNNGTTTINITDNDNNNLPSLSLNANSYTVTEEGNNVTATITASSAPSNNLSVVISNSDSSALSTASSTTLPAGQTSTTFSLSAINDTDSDNETVNISISATGYNGDSAQVSIIDNDNVNSSLTISNVNIIEDTEELTISWTTNIAATAVVEYGEDTDYDDSVTINSPSTSQSVTLDDLDSDEKYFFRITANTATEQAIYTGNARTEEETDEDIIITEIMYHPEDEDEDDNEEWIEIYNDGDDDEDLENWILEIDDEEYVITRVYEIDDESFDNISNENDAFELKEGHYALITDDVDSLEDILDDNDLFDEIDEKGDDVLIFEVSDDFEIDNDGDIIRILNENRDETDEVEFEDNWGYYEDDDGEGYSLAKNSISGTDNDDDWDQSSEEIGTPGYTNCVTNDDGEDICVEEENNSNVIVISDIRTTPLAYSSTLIFRTSPAASATVRYGRNQNNLDRFVTSSSKTNHTVSLNNLEKQTTYYYRIEATSGSNSTNMPILSFLTKDGTTDITDNNFNTSRILFSDVRISPSNNSALIEFAATNSVSPAVSYGTSSLLGMKQPISPRSGQNSTVITNLQPGTQYFLKISDGTSESGLYNFTTAGTSPAVLGVSNQNTNPTPTITNTNSNPQVLGASTLPSTGLTPFVILASIIGLAFIVQKKLLPELRKFM